MQTYPQKTDRYTCLENLLLVGHANMYIKLVLEKKEDVNAFVIFHQNVYCGKPFTSRRGTLISCISCKRALNVQRIT